MIRCTRIRTDVDRCVIQQGAIAYDGDKCPTCARASEAINEELLERDLDPIEPDDDEFDDDDFIGYEPED
jgi:hypothetical protein